VITAVWKSFVGPWMQKIAGLLGPLRPRGTKYHPERHYMRGPGPKVRAKTSAGLHQG
jgi:hypothetical protein